MALPFISDLEVPGMAHAILIRSPAARGTIDGIDGPPLPDGYRLIRAEDIPGANMLRAFSASIPVLAELSVGYVGEPVAILAGPDRTLLEALRERIVVRVSAQAPRLSFEKFSSEQVELKKVLAKGDVDAAFAAAARVVETRCRTGPQEHYYSEPNGALAAFEGGRLVIRSSTQWPFHARATVSDVLDIDAEDIVVRAAALGAHLDGKLWYASLVAAQAALAAYLLKRPVKLLFERREDFLYSLKRSRTSIRHRAAVDAEGRILGIDAQIYLDVGAYGPLAEEAIDRLSVAAAGAYECPAFRAEAWAVSTNNPPMGAFAGLGMAAAFFAAERLAQAVADGGAEPPDAWRRRNALAQGGTLPTGAALRDYVPLDEVVEVLCAASDFRRKQASYALQSRRGGGWPRRGIGLALCYQGNGFSEFAGAREDCAVEVALGKDLSIEIRSSVQVGEDLAAHWKALAAERLSIPPEQVRIREPATDSVPDSGPSTLSRGVAVVTPLVDKCLEQIQKQRFRAALPIVARKRRRSPREAALPFASLSWGGAVVEAEVDETSLEVRPRKVWICVSAGAILGERGARAALEAATLAALGWAQAERLTMDAGGVDEASYLSYGPIAPGEAPSIDVRFVGPHGGSPRGDWRGLGELPGHCVPAALAQAIAQATGRACLELPLPLVHAEEEGPP